MTDSTPDQCVDAQHASAKPVSAKGFGVAASPFNGIKLELGICLVLGVCLWLAADSITADEGAQLLLFWAYGLLSMVWLVLRTRVVLRRCEAEREKAAS